MHGECCIMMSIFPLGSKSDFKDFKVNLGICFWIEWAASFTEDLDCLPGRINFLLLGTISHVNLNSGYEQPWLSINDILMRKRSTLQLYCDSVNCRLPPWSSTSTAQFVWSSTPYWSNLNLADLFKQGLKASLQEMGPSSLLFIYVDTNCLFMP